MPGAFLFMPKLTAMTTLTGSYGTVHEGDIFEVSEADAESLEMRGLACRYFAPATYETKVIVPEDPQKRRRESRA